MSGLTLCRWLTAAMLDWLLGGCLIDQKSVMDPASAVDVPGLAGAWQPIGG